MTQEYPMCPPVLPPDQRTAGRALRLAALNIGDIAVNTCAPLGKNSTVVGRGPYSFDETVQLTSDAVITVRTLYKTLKEARRARAYRLTFDALMRLGWSSSDAYRMATRWVLHGGGGALDAVRLALQLRTRNPSYPEPGRPLEPKSTDRSYRLINRLTP